jgi:hypothetical protein
MPFTGGNYHLFFFIFRDEIKESNLRELNFFLIMFFVLINVLIKLSMLDKTNSINYNKIFKLAIKLNIFCEGIEIKQIDIIDSKREQGYNAGKAKSKNYIQIKQFLIEEYTKMIKKRKRPISDREAGKQIARMAKKEFPNGKPISYKVMPETFRKWIGRYKKRYKLIG